MKTAHHFASLLIGLSREQADVRAAKEGFITRVVMADGFQYYVTTDNMPNRINLILIENKVVEVSVG